MNDEYSDTVLRIRRKSWKLTLVRTIGVWIILGWLIVTTIGAIILLIKLWPAINDATILMTNLNTLTHQGQFFLGDLTNLTHRISDNLNELIDDASGQIRVLPSQLQIQIVNPLQEFLNNAQNLIQRINQLLEMMRVWDMRFWDTRFWDMRFWDTRVWDTRVWDNEIQPRFRNPLEESHTSDNDRDTVDVIPYT